MGSDETVVLERGRATTRVEPSPDRRRRRTGVILLTVIILAILGVATWAVIGLIGGAKTVKVPDVKGLSTSAAFDRLQKLGLHPRIGDGVSSATVPANFVVRTDPPAGSSMKTGEDITIIPSSGQKFVQVPDVTGKTEAQARSAITKAGLAVGNVTRQPSETVGRGLVISQNPTGSTFIQPSKKVDLVISSGKPQVTVPDVTGLTQADAVDALQRANLVAQVVNEDISPTCFQAVGSVCRQDPAGGDQVTEGSTVTIFVAQEPGGGSPSPSSSPSPTPSF